MGRRKEGKAELGKAQEGKEREPREGERNELETISGINRLTLFLARLISYKFY